MKFNKLNNQNGVAVITAILVLAIATTAAATIAANYELDFRRSENTLYSSQAWAYAKGAEEWAMAILNRDLEDGTHDSLDEDWAIELPPFELPGGYIVGKIDDAQSKINLNNIWDGKDVNLDEVARLKRLFVSLNIDPELVDAIKDYIDEDLQFSGSAGCESDVYQGLENPYLPADQYMADITELRLICGFEEDIYNTLLPYVTALPHGTTLNLNTVPAKVIESLHDQIDEQLAQTLIDDRADNPYLTPNEFMQNPILRDAGISLSSLPNVSVNSSYFLLKTRSVIGKSQILMSSLINRTGKNNLSINQRNQVL